MVLKKNALIGSIYPYQLSSALELQIRNFLLSPKQHLKRLPIQKGFRVVEVGCGSGFYSVAVARFLEYGTLTLIDIQDEMLTKAQNKMHKARLDNVHYINTDAVKLPLPVESVDMIYLVASFGELHEQQRFLHEARRVLKTGGVLSVSEHQPIPAFMPMDVVESRIVPAGFHLPDMFGWQWNYTLNFKKE